MTSRERSGEEGVRRGFCNLPCVYTLLRLISKARYVSKNLLSRDKI